MKSRILFILKHREAQWGGQYHSLSSGLSNSVRFIVDMLTSFGVEAKMVEVPDNNFIDREVTAYKPTHVIIEAFWVVPEKFDVLIPLHPDVHWAVRNHSEIPFLANEGIAFEWVAGYVKRDVEIMCNAPRALKDIRTYIRACGGNERLVSYAPNFYPLVEKATNSEDKVESDTINVGCFGAIRPLKNHMQQAVSALTFAREKGKALKFHVNGGRVEGGGGAILKNLRAMFSSVTNAEMLEYDWMPHEEFLKVLSTMDVNLQISFSETFNIVTADAVAMGVSVISSREVPWLGDYAHADPTSGQSIVAALHRVWDESRRVRISNQRRDLLKYCHQTEEEWLARFG